MRISGVFRADNAEGFARILATHYGAVMGCRGEHTLIPSCLQDESKDGLLQQPACRRFRT